MKKDESLFIEGMSCDSCRTRIEKDLSLMEGIESIHVSLVSRIGNVELDTEKTSIEKVIEKIDSLGYKASILQNADESKLEDMNSSLGYQKWGMYTSLILFFIIFAQMLSGAGITLFQSFSLPQNLSVFFDGLIQAILCLIIFILGKEIIIKGSQSILKLKPNMYALVTIGSVTGFIYSCYKLGMMLVHSPSGTESIEHVLFFDSAASIISFMMLGKYLEAYGKKLASKSLFDLLKTKPQVASVYDEKGELSTVEVGKLKQGDVVLVKPGEQIPVDGIIIKGESEIDESLLTGESVPIMKKEGDIVTGGSFNTNGTLTVEVKVAGDQSVFSQMLELLTKIGEEKKGLALLADKVAFYFIPFILLCSVFTLIFWTLKGAPLSVSIEYFMTILVIACPCALGLATPLAITTAIFGTAKKGFLITDSKALESVSKINQVFFDKTGTLTDRMPQVTEFIEIQKVDKEVLFKEMIALELQSHHPLASALIVYGLQGKEGKLIAIQNEHKVEDMQVTPGKGIEGSINGRYLKIGNKHLMNNLDISDALSQEVNQHLERGSTVLYIQREKELIGYFVLDAKVQPDAQGVINFFKKNKKGVSLLSGDHPTTVEKVAKQLGMTEFKGQMNPFDKVELIKEYQAQGKQVMMVGDGLNDSLALKQADLSICMSQGSEISLKSASIVMNQAQLGKIPSLLKYLMRTNKIIKQNLFWALFYNVLTIPLAMGLLAPFGIPTINPMIGALSMSLSSILVTINSLRLKRYE